MTRLVVGSATDIGLVRSNNQDQLLVAPGLYAVADGMGGHAAGEVASLTAIKALDAAFEASDERTAASLESAAKAANRAVWEQARTNREMLGMGTTLVALAVVENDDGTSGLAVAHIGDSRLYLYRDKALSQVTVDHSLVQELIDEGQISQAQAAVHPQRHVLTRALGVEPAVDVDVIQIAPENNDRYLLCSDGLPREASDDQIAAILSRFPDPSEAAKELVELANSRGGSDNVTVVVVDVQSNEQSPDTLIIVPGPATSASPESSGTQMADRAPGRGWQRLRGRPTRGFQSSGQSLQAGQERLPQQAEFKSRGFRRGALPGDWGRHRQRGVVRQVVVLRGLGRWPYSHFSGPSRRRFVVPADAQRPHHLLVRIGAVLQLGGAQVRAARALPRASPPVREQPDRRKKRGRVGGPAAPAGRPATTAHVPTTVHVPTTSRPPVSTVRTIAEHHAGHAFDPYAFNPYALNPYALDSGPHTVDGPRGPTTHARTTTHVGTTTHTATTHTGQHPNRQQP